jgi:LysM repeat protein
MGLRDKYSQAVTTAKQLGMEGSAEERDGKLHFNGTVKSEDEKNKIWNALKTIPDWQKEVVADIRVKPGAQPSSSQTQSIPQPTPAKASLKTYTVKSGDTLSEIAKRELGSANKYMEHLQRQPRSAQRPGHDQARAGAQDSGLKKESGVRNRESDRMIPI